MKDENYHTTRRRGSSETSARQRTDRDGARGDDDSEGRERSGGAGLDGVLSRRRFLASSAAAGALAVGAGTASAQSTVDSSCAGEFETIEVANAVQLMNNKWGMQDAEQCIWLNDDGSYGYDFDARGATCGDSCINYPEVFVGTRPWGDDTGAAEFPIRRGDVQELTMSWDVDLNISGGEWDLAEEWWLIDGQPGENPDLRYEVMLVLDWGGNHSHYMEAEDVATDQYGNTLDHWAAYESGGTDADFHIFRIRGGAPSGQADLTEIIDYLDRRYGVSDDLTLTGIELGNEYWDGAYGDATYHQFDVTVNGSTYTSGSDGGSGGSSGGSDDGTNDGSTDDGSTDDGTSDGSDGGSGGLVAEIDPRKTSVDVGEYVGFEVQDTSGSGRHIEDLAWALGDGTTDSGWYADNTYDSAGDYVVELTATGSDGAVTTDSVTVTVGGGSSDGGSDGSTDDGTSDGSTDDGSTDDGSTDDGSTDDGTSDGSTDDGTSDGGDQPHAEVSPSTTTASPGETIYFSIDANVDWLTGIEWDMGDGTTHSGTWHVAHEYDSSGSYTVELSTQSGHSGTWTTDTVTIDVS